jgi:tetratricopeptide (TPR) repeat protein
MLPITMPKSCPWLAVLTIFLIVLLTLPARADMYQRCVALVERDPDAAYDMALEWEASDLSGGAFHCSGLALAALKLFDAAAERFQRAALQGQRMSDVERATLLRQSGEAWLLANRGSEAVGAFTKALAYVPQDPSLLYGRARSYDLNTQSDEALIDVKAAIALAPERSLPYLLKARLNRQLGKLADAARDVETAIALGVDMIPARLERGLIRYEQNDNAGALEDWSAVVAADVTADGRPGYASTAATRFIAELEANPTSP